MASCQVTPITHRANTKAGFTGNCRAHNHFIHSGLFKQINQRFIKQHTLINHQIFTGSTVDRLCGYTAKYTFTEGLNNITAFNDRFQAL